MDGLSVYVSQIRCWAERKLDENKFNGLEAFAAIGVVTDLVFKTPIVGF